MHIHILGICGTFMGGLAVLAKQQGHYVTGSDSAVYPPMSTQLIDQNIPVFEGYEITHLNPTPDCILIGNALSRGNPLIEYILEQNLPYYSGPQWLSEHILADRWVLAVAGTHGKTTTSSLLTWILESAGLQPGFLIGGVPENFGVSARLSNSSPFFIIEADEYDTAFFDKRAKFIHYHPRTLIFNNLEFDHADIFSNLEAIKKQFHYLVRTVPGNGLIIYNAEDANLKEVIDQGRWTPCETFATSAGNWQANSISYNKQKFNIVHEQQVIGTAHWHLLGEHNINNALAAIVAARHVGVSPEQAVTSLSGFKNVKRRLEKRGIIKGITIYDDFAHHPTAIACTLAALRHQVGSARILAILEFASYTMRQGYHRQSIVQSLQAADYIICKRPADAGWDPQEIISCFSQPVRILNHTVDIVEAVCECARAGDHILIMSNREFDGIHDKLLACLDN